MGRVSVLIAGDIIPRRNYELFSEGKVDQLFAPEILELFRNADFRICNLEGALTESEEKLPKCGPSIKAPPETALTLHSLGIDCVTLANNHITDFGTSGYLDTCKTLEKNGIQYFGAGHSINDIQTHFSTVLHGRRITFYAVSETVFNIPSDTSVGVNLYDEYRVCNELKSLKENCDCLIVLYHGGAEYFQYPTPWIQCRFHRMVECGADLVIAQHSHCIGAKEDYCGAYLLYGQGNFHFVQSDEPQLTGEGLLLELHITDETVDVKHHLVRRDGDYLTYDVNQELSSFFERSRRIADGDTFSAEYSAYSEKWMLKWLLEFRGLTFSDRVMRKLLPKEKYIRYLRKSYKDVTVLRLLEHVRGEEDVEVMQRGLEDFFDLK